MSSRPSSASRSSSNRSRSRIRRRPPRPSYEVQNAAIVRKCVLKTVKQMLLCKDDDLHLSLDLGFQVTNVSTTSQALANLLITKGEEAEEEYDETEDVKEEPKPVKNVSELFENEEHFERGAAFSLNKGVVRPIPTGEYYAVRQWSPPSEGDEPAIREKGDREDATSNDTHSLESCSTTSVGAPSDALEKILKAIDEPLPTFVEKKAAPVQQPPPTESRVVSGSFDVQKGAKGKNEAVMTIHCPKETK